MGTFLAHDRLVSWVEFSVPCIVLRVSPEIITEADPRANLNKVKYDTKIEEQQ